MKYNEKDILWIKQLLNEIVENNTVSIRNIRQVDFIGKYKERFSKIITESGAYNLLQKIKNPEKAKEQHEKYYENQKNKKKVSKQNPLLVDLQKCLVGGNGGYSLFVGNDIICASTLEDIEKEIEKLPGELDKELNLFQHIPVRMEINRKPKITFNSPIEV